MIGGYAFSSYTEPRGTKDLDIWIAVSEPNSIAVYSALAAFGSPLSGMTPADFRDGKSFFIMGQPPARFDILQTIDAVTFAEAWASRVAGDLEGIPTHFISRELLIRNKRAVGRPRDLLDVAMLEGIDEFYR